MNVVLGISAYYHDSAAALLINGEIVAAAQEERFTRNKNTEVFPANAIQFCLSKAELSLSEIDAIVFYEKPFLKFERILTTYLNIAPRGILSFLKSIPVWLKDKLHIKQNLKKEIGKLYPNERVPTILFSKHHLSHAAHSYLTSGFGEAAILTIDGVGESQTATIAHGKMGKIEILRSQNFPNSLGLFYSAVTYYLGFTVNSGEYKVMGLSAYANRRDKEVLRLVDLFKNYVIRVSENGSVLLNQQYFNYLGGLKMSNNKRWLKLFGIKKRSPESEVIQVHKNMALAAQIVVEEAIFNMAKHALELTGCKNLCLGGGVALNVVANYKLQQSKLFDNVNTPFAPGDAGAAIGAALYVYSKSNATAFDRLLKFNNPTPYLGPNYLKGSIETSLKNQKLEYTSIENRSEFLIQVAQLLHQNKVIGWFQGSLEFGPRALGNRSILANPLNPEMQKIVNKSIKFREEFRPFAPAVLLSDADRYFEESLPSPYMSRVFRLKEEFLNPSLFPAITHVDGTARVQTVTENQNKIFYDLLNAFKNLSGHGMLLNTSFNVRGEPIVANPTDAINCFLKTEMDYLVIDQYIITKKDGIT